MKRSFYFLGLFILLFSFSVGVFAQNEITIAGLLEASTEDDEPQFTMLVQALEAADLLDALDDADAALTVFAPTDEAFEALLDELEIDLEALLADPDALSAILLYHVVDDVLLEDDFEDDTELETLNGASLAVTVTSSGDIILDEFANVVETDLEADNGIIHVIDGVLLPPDETSTDSSSAAEACVVFTEDAGTVAVRVGPGENRTSIAFLPANVEFEVLGQATDADGNIWFKLDKEQATPNRSNAEAWIAADAVESSGNCDDVLDVNAPPVIPITNQIPPTPAPSGDGGGDTGTGDTGQPDTSGQINVSTGSWTRTFATSFDASCAGFGNVNLPTNEYFIILGNSFNLNRNGTGFNLGSLSFAFIGDNTYQASGSLGGGETGTWYLRAVSANRLEGRYIWSFSADNGASCSATLYVTFTR